MANRLINKVYKEAKNPQGTFYQKLKRLFTREKISNRKNEKWISKIEDIASLYDTKLN